jgi:hypothetical protein
VAWLRRLAALEGVRWLVPAHYDAPIACSPGQLAALADQIEARAWAPRDGNWAYLAGIDDRLVQLGVVPDQPVV